MMNRRAVVFALIAVAPFAALAGSADDRVSLVQGNTRFALELYHRLGSDDGAGAPLCTG